ncbi:MAG: MCE family protein [Sphingobacteriaceae bacterium]|nr:MCE family protein [Sphingobacteriaceae bacterium]
MGELNRNVKLGVFVITGSVLLILALYLIGNKQNLFGNTIQIHAEFKNVNGLMSGNNVRYSGIDVGTVEAIQIISDSSVKVTMIIDKATQRFIKKNAIASIGTDGLMGNKLINIASVKAADQNIEEGDVLKTLTPVEMEEMIRTLNVTNENIKVITDNLKDITEKISNKNSLWNVLLDTTVADNVKSTVVNLRYMSEQGLAVTGDLRNLSKDIKEGKGSLGALITDTTLSSNIHQAVVQLNRITDTTAYLSGNISEIVKNLKDGKGTIGVLLHDTTLVHDLNQSILKIDKGAGNFDLLLEALKHSWPFKKYFKKKKVKK